VGSRGTSKGRHRARVRIVDAWLIAGVLATVGIWFLAVRHTDALPSFIASPLVEEGAQRPSRNQPTPVVEEGAKRRSRNQGTTAEPKAIHVSIIGDGATLGDKPSRSSYSVWPVLIHQHMNVVDEVHAIPGTGYVAGDAFRQPFASRLTNALVDKPDVLLVVGSRADATQDPAVVRTAALDLYRAARRMNPKLTILAIGPIWDATRPSRGALAADQAVRSAAADAHVIYVSALTWLNDPHWLGRGAVPNAAGQEALATRIATVLTRHVRGV